MSESPSNGSFYASPSIGGCKKEDERSTLAIYDGSYLIERTFKCIESNWEKNPAIGSICIYKKAQHWAKYFFAKFYKRNDLAEYNYAYIALACVYLVLKIQESEKTHIISISAFLGLTRAVWQPYLKERVEGTKTFSSIGVEGSCPHSSPC